MLLLMDSSLLSSGSYESYQNTTGLILLQLSVSCFSLFQIGVMKPRLHPMSHAHYPCFSIQNQ